MRGKTVRYTLVYPDGKEETLLYLPRYNFNWQLTYRTSKEIPKGAKMLVQFTYDNSTASKDNPDPSTWVYFGGSKAGAFTDYSAQPQKFDTLEPLAGPGGRGLESTRRR